MSAAAPGLCIACLIITVAPTGCTFAPPEEPDPDLSAIVTVVQAVYGQPSGKPTIFLGAEGEGDTEGAAAREAVASTLNAKVLALSDREFDASDPPFTPLDPSTGEPGVTIALGRFNMGEDGTLRVTASYVMDKGLKRGCTEFVLSRHGGGWSVVDSSDGWPDCVLSEEIIVSYDTFVEQVRSGDCHGLGAAIGTCGPWLAIREQHIDSGRTYYFDPDTRLMVGQDSYDFSLEPGEAGEAVCDVDDFVETEYVICE